MGEESERGGLIVLPSLPRLLSDSEDTRTGVVRALGEQYQRLLQSAPRAMTGFLAPYRGERASESWELAPARRSGSAGEAPPATDPSDGCPRLMMGPPGFWQCGHCQFTAEDSGMDETLTIQTTDDDTLGIAVKALWDWHEKSDRGSPYFYKCKICNQRQRSLTLRELGDHISHQHTTDDVLHVLGDDARFLYLERPEDKEPMSAFSHEILYSSTPGS